MPVRLVSNDGLTVIHGSEERALFTMPRERSTGRYGALYADSTHRTMVHIVWRKLCMGCEALRTTLGHQGPTSSPPLLFWYLEAGTR